MPSPVPTSAVKSLELERDELKREVDRLRTSSSDGDAHARLKAVRSRVAPRAFDPTSMAYTPSPRRPQVQGPSQHTQTQAEEAAEARCKAAEARAAEAERTCEERCAKADELVKKLEADLARDFAASKAVETCLDERNLELKAEKRKSESLQAALDAAQAVEPTGDDEADKLRESLPRAAALERSSKPSRRTPRRSPSTRRSRRGAARPPRRRRRNSRPRRTRCSGTPTKLRSCAAPRRRRWPRRRPWSRRCRRSYPWRGRRATRPRRRFREAEARASQARSEVTETAGN